MAGIDLIRIGKHRPIGLKNQLVFRSVAVALLGDRPERVTLCDGMEFRLGLFLGRRQVFLDLRYAFNVSCGKNDFFLDLLRWDFAADFYLVANNLHLQLVLQV